MSNLIRKYRISILIVMGMLFVLIFMLYNVTGFEPINSTDDVKANASATVEVIAQQGTILADKDSVVEEGYAAYFFAYDPLVRITPNITLSKAPTGTMEVQTHTSVTLHSIDSKGKEFWSESISASLSTEYSISSTESLYLEPLEINMMDQTILLDSIQTELDSTVGIAEVVVKTTYTLKGLMEGKNIIRVISQSVPLVLQQDYFTVLEKNMYESNVTIVSGTNTSLIEYYAADIVDNQLLLLELELLLFIGFIVSIVLATRQKSLELREHNRFKEWITEGSVDIRDRALININSLEGLVDLAIDTDKRVIYDKSTNQYCVILDDVLYRYVPASKKQSKNAKGHLGNLLVKKGLLSQDELETGLYYHQQTHKRLGEALLDLGFINSTVLYSELAFQSGVAYLDVENIPLYNKHDWLKNFSIMKAKSSHLALIGQRKDGTKVIATVFPVDEEKQKQINTMFGEQLRIVATSPMALHKYLDRLEEQLELEASPLDAPQEQTPIERLGMDKTTKFIHDFMHGILHMDLFIVASGYISFESLQENLQHQTLNQWVNNSSKINEGLIKLLYTLKTMIQDMYATDPSSIMVPDLMSLLHFAGYLSNEDIIWVETEMRIKAKPMKEILVKNYFISEETFDFGERVLKTLNKIIIN